MHNQSPEMFYIGFFVALVCLTGIISALQKVRAALNYRVSDRIDLEFEQVTLQDVETSDDTVVPLSSGRRGTNKEFGHA